MIEVIPVLLKFVELSRGERRPEVARSGCSKRTNGERGCEETVHENARVVARRTVRHGSIIYE